jgi:hypothetical protein
MQEAIREDPQTLKSREKKNHKKKVEVCKVKRIVKSSEPFLSFVRSVCPELVEVLFEGIQGFFPEPRTAWRDVFSETPSPVSSTSVGDFQSVKISEPPPPTPAALQPTLNSSPR